MFYALAYTGFLVPAVLALLSPVLPYPVLFAALGVVALLCALRLAREWISSL